jgi:tight adherence protein B
LTLLAVAAPYFRVLHCRRRRLEQIEAQLPDALDYLARALRAGHPFSLALEMLGGEKSPPLSSEIRRAVEERRLGGSWEDVFEGLCRRVPVQEMGVFAAAALLQARTGGRLTEVLSRLAENMRESAALRGEVRAISAHGRLSGLILTLMPVVVVAIMSVVNPGYLGVLLRHPYGEHLIGAAVAALVSAHLLIRRMVAVRV